MEHIEEYKGYILRRAGNGINIYDENGAYVIRVESLIVHEAEIKVDEIIHKNG